ncbi:MAG: DNRLRE domain-containing protein, partial [Methanomethylovorans sp.]|nr:DNRLRE domain-containing protein [Methanomethylovorans sp.]
MTGFTQVLNSGNYDLVTPYTFTAYSDKFTITGDLGLDNGDPEGTEVNEDNDTVPAPDLTIVEHSTAYDNRLRGSSPTTVLPSSNFIDVGGLGTGSYRDVMMFDLSGYKTTDTISKATLSLYWYYPAGTTRISDTVVEIYRPASQWDPKSVTWNSRAAGFPWSTAGGSWYDKNAAAQGSTPYASLTFPAKTVPDNRYYEFDVTQLVQEYVSGNYEDTGFFIKARTEGNNYIAFYSSDWSNSAQRPMLIVTLTSGSSQPTDNVQDSVPVANAGADQTVTVDSEVIFDGSASTDDNGIASYSWDFGDGTVGSGEVSPVHTYITAGTYTVTLTVTDTVGQTATDTVTVVVSGTTMPTGPDTPTSGSVSYSATYDNRLREPSPTTVLPSSNFIDVGGLGTSSYRDVMMFDLSGYKTTDTISKATLSLYWYYPAGTTRTSDTVVEIYRPAVQWDPKSVTWNSRAAGFPWSTAGGSWYDKNAAAQGST